MKFLNRETSPIAPAVWAQIDGTLSELLSQRLKMRSVVDYTTVDFATDAIATGELRPISSENGITVSARNPVNMVELCYEFSLPKSVVEALKRDKKNFDDTVFRESANLFSTIENGMILDGLDAAGIEGLLEAIERDPIAADGVEGLVDAVSAMMARFGSDFVGGPFRLVLSAATLVKMVGASEGGVSVKERIEHILGTENLVVSNAVGDDKLVALSARGGDFIFYNGLDVSVGYAGETDDAYTLFIMESCALRILAPEAAQIITL